VGAASRDEIAVAVILNPVHEATAAAISYQSEGGLTVIFRSAVLAFVIVLTATRTEAQSASSEPYTLVYRPALLSQVEAQKDLPYRVVGAQTLRYDFYRLPRTRLAQPLPVVIVMNGFGVPDMKNADFQVDWAKLLAAEGFAAITFESHQEDVPGDFDALVEHVQKEASRLGVNPNQMSMIAFSGNVTNGLPIAMDPKRKNLKAAVFYYGSGPVQAFRYDLPTLFVRSGLDNPNLNRQIDSLAFRALRGNAPVQLINHSGGHHGFEFEDSNHVSVQVLQSTFDFIRRAASPESHDAIQRNSTEILAGAALAEGRWQDAVRGFEQLTKQRPNQGRLIKSLADSYYGAEEYKKAVEMYEEAWKLRAGGPRDIALPASIAAARIKDKEQTLAWLRILVRAPNGKNIVQNSAVFDFVRGEAEYVQLMN